MAIQDGKKLAFLVFPRGLEVSKGQAYNFGWEAANSRLHVGHSGI